MRKRDRILKKERARAEQRRRKAAVYILGYHRRIFSPMSIRQTFHMAQIQPTPAGRWNGARAVLDPKLPWWRQPTSSYDIDKLRKSLGYKRSYHDILWTCRTLGSERLALEMEMLSRTWKKQTKRELREGRTLSRNYHVVIGGALVMGAWALFGTGLLSP